jgi:hypothetical protein
MESARGLARVLVTLGFAGASAIQFHERHFFYLQFVPWCAFGLLADTVIHARQLVPAVTRRRILRAAIFVTLVAGFSGAAVALSRAYQQQVARRLLSRYEETPRTPLNAVRLPSAPGRTLIASPAWRQPMTEGAPPIETRFIAVTFRDDLCGPGTLPVVIRYDGTRRDADLSEPVAVRLRSERSAPTTLFVVAYDWADGYIRFRGIEVASGQSHCIDGLSNVEHLERLPLLLTTTLGAGWRQERLSQRLQ